MSGTGLTIPYTLGCSLSFVVTWTDSAGDPLNLTGWSASIFGATQEFTGGRVTAAITDAAAGELTVTIEAIDSLPLRRADIGFRFKIYPPSGPEDGKSLGFVSVYAT